MSVGAWAALAFVAGLTSVIVYYKDLRWLAGFILFGLPFMVLALLGRPHDTDFIDTSGFSIMLWVVLGFVGAAISTTAVVLRIIR